MDDCNVKCMNQFGHHVDEEEDGDIENEKLDEYSEEEEER